MPKRITYLTRRADISADIFSAHWSSTHAAIAVDLPGVEAYRQNHLISDKGPSYDVDGIVELWFVSDEFVAAGMDSAVADRLVEDEPRFLSGLVGGAVHAGQPTPHWPIKVWVLARWSGGEQVAAVERWAARLATGISAAGYAVNVVDMTGPQLVRDKLAVDPEPPHVAIAFGFSRNGDVNHARSIVAASAETLAAVSRVQTMTMEERVII